MVCCSVLPPYGSAVCFYCVFNLYNCVCVWMGALESHTPGVGSPHLSLSQAGHTMAGVVLTGQQRQAEGKEEVAKGGQDLPGLC